MKNGHIFIEVLFWDLPVILMIYNYIFMALVKNLSFSTQLIDNLNDII